MRGPRVADVNTAPFALLYNRVGLALSVLSVLNVASTPLTAYFSEYFPWAEPPAIIDTFANYTEFNAQMLAQHQLKYNNSTLPQGATYFADTAVGVYLARATLRLDRPSSSLEECIGAFLLGAPGLIFYTSAQLALVCGVLRSPNATAVNWAAQGACFRGKFCGAVIGHSCLWLTPGDAIGNVSDDGRATLSFAYTETRHPTWLWLKLVYRIATTGGVFYCVWHHYYRQCLALARQVRASGHCIGNTPRCTSYKLVIGDPTALLLIDPWVATAFVLDIWSSCSNIAIAVFQATQNADSRVLLVSVSYLARTVWFSYWALAVAARALKRWRLEHWFQEVDPTVVAVAVSVYGPLFTWLIGHVAPLAALFQWTFTCLVPADAEGQEVEAALGSLLYTLVIASLTLSYGTTAAALRHWRGGVARQDYSSFRYNTWKSRAVFEVNPRYKRYPTISCRSTDCFLLCYEGPHLQEKLRLTLLSSLDFHEHDPMLAVGSAPIPTDCLANVLVPPKPCPLGVGGVLAPRPKWRPSNANGMAPSKVADSAEPLGQQRYPLRRNRLGLFVSLASLCNIASMPLAAYLSEYLPWTGPIGSTTATNYSSFNAEKLTLVRRRYNRSTLPAGIQYTIDTRYDVQVARQILRLGQPPASVSECFRDYLLGLPGLIFYSNTHVDLICHVLQSPNTSAVRNWDAEGSCFVGKFCSFAIGYTCVWLVPGNTISGAGNASDVATLNFAYTETRNASWVWAMFFYRLATTTAVWLRMWRCYYRHCVDLEHRVQREGHRRSMQRGAWSYELIVGDPTAIVLLDPWIASAFFLDIWLSCSNLAIAVLQVTQNVDFRTTAFSMTYLARAVWFAYWGLCIVSYFLKRWHKEHLFAEVDPTLVAVAVAVYGPLLTWTNGNVAMLARLYQSLFNCLVPPVRQGEEVEAVVGSIVYTCIIVSLPLFYGFAAPHHRRDPAAIEYHSFNYNNLKNRLALRMLAKYDAVKVYGGNVHAAVHADPRLKSCPTVSLCATDCFLLCYCNGRLEEKLRLSLVRTLDVQRITITDAKEPSRFHMNELRLPRQRVLVEGTLGPSKATAYELQRPTEPSVWCL
ncbi:hypothetical protein ACHHYP_08118 [Achlya hypogyna]|uniref:Transmembrane protein n=1 Tax=Achlya hypogyna TaxID=1202772 RepID=A0A1V9YPK8_ACHHY|nr:hypothetical protein ACHHYP_08118 [Achlya hypogyna]